MCGIVGFVTDSPGKANSIRANFMGQALYVDALRGQDATGVFSVRKNKKAYFMKDSCDARLFLQQPQFVDCIDDFRSDRYLAIGHNRKTTLGGNGYANAHPFTSGPICVVHNGTLRDWHNLPRHSTGTSDSARVATALAEAEPGGLDVLAKLKGDFALVWYDVRSTKLYLTTNGRRPLDYLRYGDHTFFSSEGMLAKFVLSRLIDDKLPRISHFKPLHLYSVEMGSVDFTTEKYEDAGRTVFTPINRQYSHGSSHNSIADAVRAGTGSQVMDRNRNPGIKKHNGAGGVIPNKETIALLKFPGESNKAAKKRMTKTNQLLRASEVDMKVGDVLEINRETYRQYETDANKRSDDPMGEVHGFMEWVLDGDDIMFHASVHNCPIIDVFSDMVDTVKCHLFGAYLDENGDMVLLGNYIEVGCYKKAVATNVEESEWPPFIRNFFQNKRYFYNTHDGPEHEWFESTCLLTNREMDMLMKDKACEICSIDAALVQYDDMVFVGEDMFVCNDCNKNIGGTTVTTYGKDGTKTTEVLPRPKDKDKEGEQSKVPHKFIEDHGKVIRVDDLFDKDEDMERKRTPKETTDMLAAKVKAHHNAKRASGQVWDPDKKCWYYVGGRAANDSDPGFEADTSGLAKPEAIPTAKKARLTIDNKTGDVINKETGEVYPKGKADATPRVFDGRSASGTPNKGTAVILSLPGRGKIH